MFCSSCSQSRFCRSQPLEAGLDLGVLRVQNALALAEGTLRRNRHLEVLRDAFHATFQGSFSAATFTSLSRN